MAKVMKNFTPQAQLLTEFLSVLFRMTLQQPVIQLTGEKLHKNACAF